MRNDYIEGIIAKVLSLASVIILVILLLLLLLVNASITWGQECNCGKNRPYHYYKSKKYYERHQARRSRFRAKRSYQRREHTVTRYRTWNSRTGFSPFYYSWRKIYKTRRYYEYNSRHRNRYRKNYSR